MSEAYGIWKQAVGSYEYWAETAKIDFAVLLGKKMDEQKINKATLAEKVGVSKSYVSKVLGANTNFTIESMAKFLFTLGLHLDISALPISEELRASESVFTSLRLATPIDSCVQWGNNGRLRVTDEAIISKESSDEEFRLAA